MSSKIFLLICLSLAFAALIVSDVAVARELAETSAESCKTRIYLVWILDLSFMFLSFDSFFFFFLISVNNEVESAKGVEESKYPSGGYGGNPGGGQVGPPSYGGTGNPGGGYGGGGQCTYGCCGVGYSGGGCQCCSYAGEAVKTEPQTQP